MSAFAVDTGRLRDGHGVKWGSLPPGTLGAWVADMDFAPAPVIRRRLAELTDLGYPHWPDGDPVIAAFEERMAARHGWTPMPDRTRVFSDLIQTLQIVIEHATRPGDRIAIHLPNYPPFLASITRAGRHVVPLPVVPAADFDLLETLRGCAMLIVVNPHNPTGHVFTRAELDALAAAAAELDLVVLADEIHADLVYAPHTHIPFASLSADAAARTVTATSATKAFNIAGVRCATAHIGDAALWETLAALPLDYLGQPGLHGRVATTAAWREAGPWLSGLMTLLTENRARVTEWAATLPWATGYREPQATYLAWLDCTGSPLGPDPAGHLLRHAGVKVSAGAEFSPDTAGFIRINFATSPDVLSEVLSRISRAGVYAAAG
ncbi:cystathionine beta-lyase [Catenuloplanes nepalensis]|uniref:cysteine-S-conjugate beta-lyase n=1 Tax=Catenuloplanes nepalensis TaxID=587533 RepID=A0ABT9MWP6_9ACTN|nr:aminotransferase class I/II-fold pyridoxal phosphate-dependent enzyme [Catenuloplanes nepalensis]MDP9795864.1 cystathionine beta-lyase [Catenuloplanes nepalensis]